jgi:hypothetical protein
MRGSKLRFPGRVFLLLCSAALACVATAEKARGAADQPQSGELKFVIIVSRHGVRSPTGTAEQLNQYSAQPWPNWDVPPGHLTTQGARLMSLFGAYYRSYFAQQGLFRATGCADAAHVSFYSDSDQRTVETGKSLAAGMFPGCSPTEQSEAASAAIRLLLRMPIDRSWKSCSAFYWGALRHLLVLSQAMMRTSFCLRFPQPSRAAQATISPS